MIAAELWRLNHAAPDEDKIERKFLKSDMLIVATVKAARIEVLYSHDKKCRKLAEKVGISGRGLPESPEGLFDDLEEDLETSR
jgi:hypothetical protein